MFRKPQKAPDDLNNDGLRNVGKMKYLKEYDILWPELQITRDGRGWAAGVNKTLLVKDKNLGKFEQSYQ